jgi:cytochrome P450
LRSATIACHTPSAATARAAKIRESTYLSVPMRVTNDPPQHTQYRRISNSILTAQQMRAMGPMIEASVALYLDKMFAKDGGEFIGEFAVPLPVTVISELLGLPPDMTHKCKEWSDALMEPLSGMLSEEREIECAHEFVERQPQLPGSAARAHGDGGDVPRLCRARRHDAS